jgi:hypothetical protein
MGGSGSGRWRNHCKALRVEEVMKINLRNPQWKALLARERAEGTLQWSDLRTRNPVWANFILAPLNPDGTRNLVLHRAEDEFEQVVSLGLRRAGFSRQWFAGCRGCDSWVKTLYVKSQGDWFRCRKCSNLTYASVQQHDARLDFARRDLQGFLVSRARAPQTLRSRLVTASIAYEAQDSYRPGRSWGQKSTTPVTRMAAQWRQEYIDRWGFPPEDAGRVARGG